MGFTDIFRRKQAYPDNPPWSENINIGGIPTHVTNVGLSESLRRLIAQNPNFGTENVPANGEHDVNLGDILPSFNRATTYNPLSSTQEPQAVSAPVAPPGTEPAPPTSRFTPVEMVKPKADDNSASMPRPPSFSAGSYAGDPLTTPLQPIPRPAIDAKARFTRPAYHDTGNQRADLARYESDLSNWRNPIHKGNRFVAGLKTGAQAAGRMALAGGNAPQMLGAFIGGDVYGTAQPNIVDRTWRDEEFARAGQRLGVLDKQRQAQLDEASKVSGIRHTDAETVDILGKPKREADKVRDEARKTAQDQLIRVINDLPEFDPDATDSRTQDIVKRALALDIPLFKKERNKPAPHYDYDSDGNMIMISGGVKTLVHDSTGKPVNNPSMKLVPRRLSDGTEVVVRGSQALSDEAVAGREGYREGQDAAGEAEKAATLRSAADAKDKYAAQLEGEAKQIEDTYGADTRRAREARGKAAQARRDADEARGNASAAERRVSSRPRRSGNSPRGDNSKVTTQSNFQNKMRQHGLK